MFGSSYMQLWVNHTITNFTTTKEEFTTGQKPFLRTFISVKALIKLTTTDDGHISIKVLSIYLLTSE